MGSIRDTLTEQWPTTPGRSSAKLVRKDSFGIPSRIAPLFGFLVVTCTFCFESSSFAQNPTFEVSSATHFSPATTVSSVTTAVVTASSFVDGTPTSYVAPTSFIAPTGVPSGTIHPISSGTILRNWALEAANAKSNLDLNRFPDVATTRQRLDQSMMELENFLSTSPQHQADWLAFLHWNDLRSELSKAKPDKEKLTQIEKTFRQNFFGLEMRQFTSVRDNLANYVHALRFSDRAESIEILGNRLTKLSEQLQTPDFSHDFETTRAIGLTLSYLSQANQSHDLVAAVRANFSRSNLRVLVSSPFVQRKFSRPVSEANPVNENILGTQIYGQSWLNGWVTPQLLDSSSHAALRLNLNADFSSQSIGYNRSVKLHTQGAANIAACETIALTDQGLVTLNDAHADAGLSSQINDIEARLKIVRRIATKQAAKQKPQADAIAEGRLENRIRDQFHEKLSLQISEANQKLKAPEVPTLARLGLSRPKRTTWSSPQYLALLWKLQDNEQLAAPASCPLIVEGTGVTVQLHESAITNLLDPVLAGRILRSTEMDKLVAQFGKGVGGSAFSQNDEQPWSITLEAYHPVEVQLDNSLITFRIRTVKLDRGDQALEQPASIEASYRIAVVNGCIDLDRQGDVKIDFSGKQQRGVRAVTLRSFLKKKFDEVFKQKLLDKPFCVANNLPDEIKDMSLSSIQMDDGWIQAHMH